MDIGGRTRAGPPRRLVVGILLLAAGQTLTLVHLRPWSDAWYTIVWVGYILTGDALIELRDTASLLMDRRTDLVRMVAMSAIGWWLLELANLWFGAWDYSKSPDIPTWVQAARSTIAFSTLLPASWVTLLLVMPWMRDWHWPSRWHLTLRMASALIGGGVVAAASAIAWPTFGLALLLAAIVLVLDPLNHMRGRPSLFAQVCKGDLRVAAPLCIGGPLSGVIGEAWNYPADPKWTYDVPIIDFAYIFEMPALGYIGYAVLSCALFAIYHCARPAKPSSGGRDSTVLCASGLV